MIKIEHIKQYHYKQGKEKVQENSVKQRTKHKKPKITETL